MRNAVLLCAILCATPVQAIEGNDGQGYVSLVDKIEKTAESHFRHYITEAAIVLVHEPEKNILRDKLGEFRLVLAQDLLLIGAITEQSKAILSDLADYGLYLDNKREKPRKELYIILQSFIANLGRIIRDIS